MKNFLQTCFLAIFIFSTGTSTFAQKKIKEGFVKYEITSLETDQPELAVMKGTRMNIYFTNEQQKMDMKIMGGLVRIQTIAENDAPEKGTVLMDMMGKKIQLSDLGEEVMKNNPMTNLGDFSVKYDKKDRKKIAGYKCHKALLKLDSGMELNVYVTKKIQPVSTQFDMIFKGLEGFPLEYIINTGMGFSMTFTAQEVSGKVDKNTFLIGKGYEKMTLEEFQKQMGNLNLGF